MRPLAVAAGATCLANRPPDLYNDAMPRFVTACPRNCYSTCSMIVEVEGDRIRRIEPHAGNRATPEGVCLKGLSYVERQVSPDRILVPLRRSRPRRGAPETAPARRTPSPTGATGAADGVPEAALEAGFERISWDEALTTIAAKLEQIRAEGDPRSVLYYASSGTKGLLNGVGAAFWRLYGGYTTTYGDLCWPAGLEATRLTFGDNKDSAPWDIANARLIVMWGKNAAETNIHQMPFIEQALEAGGRLVVVDPRRTQTAERASLFLQPRPGTDGALALALARELIGGDRVDTDFVAAHVHGFDAFRERVRACTPEWAAAITEVPAAQIRDLAALMGTVAPMTICVGYGMQRYTNSGQTVRAILALLALTGNVGKPGAGWGYANLQSHVFDEVKDPLACYPPAEHDGVARVSISTARLGRDMLAASEPALRMAWVERGNPVTQNPDTHRVLRAFRRLELVVVVDQFLTDTAREADVILPAKTLFEQSDVIGAYWHPYIQLKQKLLQPAGEVKPESEIYWLLAQRLGLERAMPGGVRLQDLLPEPGDEAIEAYLERRLAPFPELSLKRLREGPVLAPGHQEIAFSDLYFPTPSGKIELLSEQAERRWGADRLPSWHEPHESQRGADGARYPLVFMTPNTKNRIHSQFNNLRMIRQFSERPLLQMHPADAASRDIADGVRVRVFNGRGMLEVEVRLDAGIKPGCVAMTNGWWICEGGTVNFLSAGRETDMGHGAAFHDNLVQVERATLEGGEYAAQLARLEARRQGRGRAHPEPTT